MTAATPLLTLLLLFLFLPLPLFESGEQTLGWIGRVMERSDKDVRAVRGVVLFSTMQPSHKSLGLICGTSMFCHPPRHHSSSPLLFLFPRSSSLCAPPLCECEAGVLEVAVRDT